MKPRLKLAFVLIFLGILAVFPSGAAAQMPSSIDGVEISMEPETPAPGNRVTVSVESFSTDLAGASIVWLVDGKNFAKGTGKKSIEVVAPSLGKKMTVLASILTIEGREVKKSITINPGGVDLIWESEGFTPPLYKGKAGFAYQNVVHITAIPHLPGTNGLEADPKTLLYKWTNNDQVVQDQSGYGKQSITLQNDLPRENDLLVEVSSPTGDKKAAARMYLEPGKPAITLYEADPLYGVLYNKSISDSFHLSNQEVTIQAVPFNFSIFKNTSLTFNWVINSLERDDLSRNESITLRTKGDTEGTSHVALSIRNPLNILQGADAALSVQFSKKKTDDAVSTSFR